MNPDIERVAEAIAERADDYYWSLLTPQEREPYYRRAEAAVEALGLTEERVILGYQQVGPYVGDTAPVVVLDDARATHSRLVGPWEELP